jgi:hypothetical protein
MNSSFRGNLYFSLSESSIASLLSAVPPRYSIVNHLHCTLQFACKYGDIEKLIGIPDQIKAVCQVWDDECQAVRVQISEDLRRVCAIAHPHVTISVLDVQPVVASALLLSPRSYNMRIDGGLLLDGSITFVPHQNGTRK